MHVFHTLCVILEIVRLGVPRLGTRRKQNTRVDENIIWPPMALRIGPLRSSALQNDRLDAPVILQCRTPQETNPKGHWGPHYFFIQSLFLLPPCTQSWYTQCPNHLISQQLEVILNLVVGTTVCEVAQVPQPLGSSQRIPTKSSDRINPNP